MNAVSPKSFPRTARLLKRADFVRVYEHGRRHFGAHMTFFYLRREAPAGGARVGLTVSRALGGAVERNRIRRRLREAVRLRRAALARPVDVVINPKRSALKTEFPALLSDVEKGFAMIERSAR